MAQSLYDQIGEDRIRACIADFYGRAFLDPIIGHFFFRSDLAALIAKQSDFAIAMLGGPRRYRGLPLTEAHRPFDIRPPHFGRRQVLMAEVLAASELPADVARAWLDLEEALRPLILGRRPGTQSRL